MSITSHKNENTFRRIFRKVFQLIKLPCTGSETAMPQTDSLACKGIAPPKFEPEMASGVFTVTKPKFQQKLVCGRSQEAHRQKVQRQLSIVFPSFQESSQQKLYKTRDEVKPSTVAPSKDEINSRPLTRVGR